MSSMDGMGMHMGSDGVSRPHNQMLARIYWYLVAAVFVFICLLSGLRALETWSRKRTYHKFSVSHPTRPGNLVSQIYATAIAISREINYPRVISFTHPYLTWLSPPPLGSLLIIITYWAIITLFLTAGSIIQDAYYWERVGFRAAWVSVTQVPFIFLTAGKINIASFLFGSSYIDVNWLHRWASRTLFVTVTIHGSFFIGEWVRAGFFQLELEMMPMVKYGLGLWAVLAWIMLSSLIPLRRLCYEFFVLQHIVSAGVFLWLLSVHVPAHASYNIWMAVAFVLTGRGFRFCVFVCRNAGIQRKRFGLTPGKGVGHTAELQGLAGEITRITIHGVKFSWKAGQHVLLWCPTLGPLESHPFTIANIAAENSSNDTTKVELIIRARSGFTRRLHQRALSSRRTNPVTVTAFVTGPFGNLPTWNAYETLVLISASTGASFTLPILESVLRSTCCVRRIECLLLVREKSHLDGYLSRLLAAASQSIPSGIALRITLAVTGKQASLGFEEDTAIEIGSTLSSSSTNARSDTLSKWPATTAESSLSSFHKVANVPERNHSSRGEEQDIGFASNGQCYKNINKQDGLLNYTLGRPSLADFIREPVEASAGETSVVVCGGKSLTSFVANCVASLSDERAVHKGTGAQGIHLHVEEFGL